jgi:DNA-binding MarR family transcriptional regulator
MADSKADAYFGPAAGAPESLTAGHLFFLLHHLVRQRESALGRELARVGLSLSQWQVLATLSRLTDATMGEVAAFCATDRTTLTRTIDRMVRDGLIKRDRDPLDRRQVHLRLTRDGRARFEAAVVDVTRFNDKATGALAPGEMERLQPTIQRILHHVLDDSVWVEDLMAFRRLRASGPSIDGGDRPAVRAVDAPPQGRALS